MNAWNAYWNARRRAPGSWYPFGDRTINVFWLAALCTFVWPHAPEPELAYDLARMAALVQLLWHWALWLLDHPDRAPMRWLIRDREPDA
jgi:hypothetical protein